MEWLNFSPFAYQFTPGDEHWFTTVSNDSKIKFACIILLQMSPRVEARIYVYYITYQA